MNSLMNTDAYQPRKVKALMALYLVVIGCSMGVTAAMNQQDGELLAQISCASGDCTSMVNQP